MYYDYFGLKEAPFSIAPNPEYLFMTARHQEALAHLYHGVKSDAGFVLLTGDIGTGKTTICRCFLSELPDNVAIAFILNPFLGGRELLITICEELNIKDVDKKSSLRALTQKIHQRLLDNHANGLTTILLIDEAQHINLKVLELIRLLTNLETNRQKLLKIILVGQPELNAHLAKPELIQLTQRITARYHINSLNLDEMSAYINYRLNVAGSMDGINIFPPSIMKTLFKMTGGVPRIINALCDRALLGVYSQNKRQVDKRILKTSLNEIKGQDKSTNNSLPLKSFLLAFAFILVAFGSWFLSARYYSNLVPPLELTSSLESAAPVVTKNNAQVLHEPQVDTLFAAVGFADTNVALAQLIRGLFIPTVSEQANCDDVSALEWRCESITGVDWQTFITINRPAIVRLIDNGEIFYAPVIAWRDEQIGFLQNDAVFWVESTEVQSMWDGTITFLWQPPQGFEEFIYFSSTPSLINWLANAFTIIDNQTDPLAIDEFNSLLKQRVQLFQEKNNLEVDGIVGRDTILRINEALGIAKALLRESVADSVTVESPQSNLVKSSVAQAEG